MKQWILGSFSSDDGIVEQENHQVVLRAKTEILSQKQIAFHAPLPEPIKDYLVIAYCALGIRRPMEKEPALIWLRRGAEQLPIVLYQDVVFDHRIHTLAVRLPEGSFDQLTVRFASDRSGHSELRLLACFSCSEAELPDGSWLCDAEPARNFRTLDLSGQYNGVCVPPDPNHRIDGGSIFQKEPLSICGIPFQTTENGGVIVPPPPPEENDEIIDNFGVSVRRRLCRPISRDSQIEIPVGMPASELFFLLTLTGKHHQRCGFCSDTTILGDQMLEVMMPLSVRDVELFAVSVCYADGRVDLAFPLNLKTNRHELQGDVGAYAVPADGSVVRSLIIHNRLLDTDCCVAAVTVNNTAQPVFPQLRIPEAPAPIRHDRQNVRYLRQTGDVLELANGALRMKVDLVHSFTLLELENDYAPEITLRPAPMIRLLDENRRAAKNLTLCSTKIEQDAASVVYVCDGLQLCVTLELDDSDGIKLQLTCKNRSGAEQKQGIVFPYLERVQLGQPEDSWYFVPKYQNLNSNESCFVYEESAPSFPMQFLDIYTPKQGGGLCLSTQERELVTRKYALEKDEHGITLFVEYPHMYGALPAGAEMQTAPTLLSAHEGDWRAGFAIYKRWLDSWYEPYHAQNKLWYRQCFWLLAEITDFFETDEIYDFPVWFDPVTKRFRFREIMERQKELTGCYPDILHLWAWTATYKDGECFGRWGNYQGEDYAGYGGKDAFCKAFRKAAAETGAQPSIYLHPTLLSSSYPQAKQFFDDGLRVINQDGKYICIQDAYRMCHANETWREYAVEMYKRFYQETKLPILYVDEFSLRVENRCYSPDHGHPVPSSLLETDRQFIQKLRDAIPEEVVLYGEYAAVDLNARYIDCNITYGIIDTVSDMIETAWRGDDGDDTFSRVYTDVYRFAFPKIVQLNLPMAMRNLSWHPQKFIFFNGEAVYDSLWDAEESRGTACAVQAYQIKKKYSDCFSSDMPQTMIETMNPAICANCFPGNGRTLYTLYNRAYTTYRGNVLRVPHRAGNVYYDAWNQRPLEYQLRGGEALLQMQLDAMQLGCIVVQEG